MVKKSGFTLIELLIAISLFVVGILSLLTIFPVNRRFLAQSANTTQAVFLAQEGLEEIKSVPYDQVTTGTYEAKHSLGSGSAGDPFGQYQRQTDVSYLNSSWQVVSTDQKLKKVLVTVFYNENGMERTYLLRSFIYGN